MTIFFCLLNLSLNELKLIAKNRGIKGYKNMSEDRLLSVLNAAESVKENEKKNFAGIESIRNEDYDANKILKKRITMPDPTKIDKTIREIRKKIVMKTKYLETFYLNQKKTAINQ